MKQSSNDTLYDKLMAGTYDNTQYGDWTAEEKEKIWERTLIYP
jgi:hypothetical protein